jgi:hypothetical protein
LAPFPAGGGKVVKASSGHYPLPFLISVPIIFGIKRTGAKIWKKALKIQTANLMNLLAEH